jgi:hypothetical protein
MPLLILLLLCPLAQAYPTANEGVVERPQSVPEPASLAILATGAAAAFLRRRK